jgi:iron complex transport system ATP-binding protein
MNRPDDLMVEELTVSYGGRPIVRGLTLPSFAGGTVTTLVGPNGAGKSTILKALAQVLPSTGVLRLGERDIRLLRPRERAAMIGFMPQGLPPPADLTVIESVIVVLQAGENRTDPEQAAMEALQRVGIAQLAMRPLGRLSGGERQLVGLAQTVAASPTLLLLDEPTSALDLARQYEVMRLVRRFAGEGATVVMVLHDLSLAAHWADHMVVLRGGRLHGAGTPDEIMTSAMLRDVYGIDGTVEAVGGRLFVVPGEPIGIHRVPKWRMHG